MSSHKKIVGFAGGILVLLLAAVGLFFMSSHRAAGKAVGSHTESHQKKTSQDKQTQNLDTTDDSKTGCVIFLHSGGFVLEKNDYHERFGQALGEVLDYDYLVPDYPINESYQETLQYMKTIYEQTRAEYDEVIMVGCSAGANLAAATMLAYGDTYGMPDGLILMSPWLDTTMENEEIQCVSSFDKEFYQNLVDWGQQYHQGDVDSELASPVKAEKEQLSKFPETVLVVGTQDILRYDAKLFEQKLTDAGVSVTYLEAEGKNHGEVFAEYASTYVMPEIMEQALDILSE